MYVIFNTKKYYVYKKATIGRFGEGKSFSLGRSSNRKKYFIKIIEGIRKSPLNFAK